MVEGKSWKGFTFQGYQDRYWFTVPLRAPMVREFIVQFYQTRKGRLSEDADQLVFSRGKRSWTYGGDDTAPDQDIIVSLESQDEMATSVSIQYDVRGCFLRIPPYGLKTEVEQLESELKKLNT